jgi:hypothetical protein
MTTRVFVEHKEDLTSVETASNNGNTAIFAKHMASVLAIPEHMFIMGYMNLLLESVNEILMHRKVSE